MDEAAHWEAFYVMAGGAAAVLTGLIFVAVTLNQAQIVRTAVHRDRAWSSVIILASQLLVAMAVLVPGQSLRALGIEILVIGALWVARTVRTTLALGPTMRRLDRPYARWQVEWAAWMFWLIALVGAGITLTLEQPAGFPLLAVAMAGMFGFAIWSAWVLISEVSDTA